VIGRCVGCDWVRVGVIGWRVECDRAKVGYDQLCVGLVLWVHTS